MKKFVILLLVCGLFGYYPNLDAHAAVKPSVKNTSDDNTLLAGRGGRGYSRPSYRPSRPSYMPSSRPSRNYSSRNKSSNSSRKPNSSYNSKAGRSARKQQSRYKYAKSKSPAKSFKTKSGKTVKINKNSKSVKKLRKDFDSKKYATINKRAKETFVNVNVNSVPSTYYGYSDPYSAIFFAHLMSMSLQQQAMWAYHHRSEMDNARWQHMVSKNAQLEAEIAKLKSQDVAVDPNYTPKKVDHDLQYSDSYVNAVVGAKPVASPWRQALGWLMAGVLTFLIVIGIIFIVWTIRL